MMKIKRNPKMLRQHGGGIVEIMVGLFVGLIVMMTVYETFAFMEASKRTTVNSNSAFSNLITGVQALERDIKLAGLGLSVKNFNTCTQLNAYYNGTVLSNNGTIAPAIIQDGAGFPDSVTVFYGNTMSAAAPARILTAMSSTTAPISVPVSADLQMGQLALLMEPSATTPCSIIGVTNVTNNGNALAIDHISAGSLYNPANPTTSFANAPLYSENAVVLNLGNARWRTWQVNNGRLLVTDKITNIANEMVTDIVHLRAQYGVTNGLNEDIAQWVDATGEWAAAALDTAHVMRIRALRVALVARNPKREKAKIAGGACDATTVAPAPWVGAAAINLSGDANWQCYKYRVLKTVLPLKNMVWSNSV